LITIFRDAGTQRNLEDRDRDRHSTSPLKEHAMNRRPFATAALVAALILAPAPFAFAQTHAHGHADGQPALMLDHGRQWPTDAPLRQHMNDIRATMAANLDRIEAGTLAKNDFAKLGATVEQKVGSIVNDCKLPPEADAQLHLIVADLIAGADVMQGKSAGEPAAGAHKVVTAVNAYAQYFDHAGFKPLG
jgi:hypothetical protein